MIPIALTIAGSDSGGGAGIQADLKTFTAFGVYGASVITAITAQNTVAVTAVMDLPVSLVVAQLDAVMDDIGAHAVKTGMLSNSALVEAVAQGVQRHRVERLVVDPVMVTKSGAHLLRADAVKTLRERLLPLALVLTPNVPEAEVLVGHPIVGSKAVRDAARELSAMGPRFVVMKGGHLPGDDVLDLLYDGTDFLEFHAQRIVTDHTHGTGCTFGAAITAMLAFGEPVPEAVRRAKEYVTGAVRHSLALGHGHGPLDHMWALRDPTGRARTSR